MNQKFLLILAATLTAFVLVTGGAIVGRAAQPAAATITPTTEEIQNLFAQREAEYQARLAEANAALEAAYAQQDAATPELAPSQIAVSTPVVAVTPQDAMLIAALVAPNARIQKMPELVDFQGTVAYEVTLDMGVIYVDANTGVVLYNGTVQPQTSVQMFGYDDDHEHGEDHDD